jgi:hypothetical protein
VRPARGHPSRHRGRPRRWLSTVARMLVAPGVFAKPGGLADPRTAEARAQSKDRRLEQSADGVAVRPRAGGAAISARLAAL